LNALQITALSFIHSVVQSVRFVFLFIRIVFCVSVVNNIFQTSGRDFSLHSWSDLLAGITVI